MLTLRVIPDLLHVESSRAAILYRRVVEQGCSLKIDRDFANLLVGQADCPAQAGSTVRLET